MNYSVVPWSRQALDPVVKELIYTAIDISTTHLFEPGTEIHVKNAIGLGATEEQILGVLQVVSLIGYETALLGCAVLEGEIAASGATYIGDHADENSLQLRDRYFETIGYWTAQCDSALKLDPESMAAFVDMAAASTAARSLDPIVRHLIAIAVTAAVTHLSEAAVRAHIQAALRCGATKDQIVEALQLSSVLGIHSISIGMPILDKVVAKAEPPIVQEPSQISHVSESEDRH